MFQHIKRIRWLQVIVKKLVMNMCTGFIWPMIRQRSGFCKHGKKLHVPQPGNRMFTFFIITHLARI